MKVVFTVGSSLIGGAENFICRLANGLRGVFPDWRFDVLVLIQKGSLHNRYVQSFDNIYYLNESIIGMQQDNQNLKGFIDEKNYDICHSVDCHSLLANLASCLFQKCSFVQNVFPEIGISKYSPSKWWCEVEWQFLSAIITENQLNLQHLHEPGQAPYILRCIPNGVDTDYWRPDENAEKVWDLIWVGRAEAAKGLDLALQIIQVMPEMKALVVTNEQRPEWHEKLSALAAAGSLDYRCAITHDELRKCYQRSRMYLHTSESEGMPATVLEAMSCGCIPIASAVGAIPWIVEDGNEYHTDGPGIFYGKLVKNYKSPEAYIQEIEKITAAPKGVYTSEGARDRVKSQFSVEHMVSAYAEIYREIERARPNIAISIPWRDRDWIAPYTLRGIVEQTYPKTHLGIRFILHNCTDDTERILNEWREQYAAQYRYIEFIIKTDDTREDRDAESLYFAGIRDGSANDPRHAQADLKNLLQDRLAPNEWWFFCDSDILLHPDCITRLIAEKRDIIGGLTNVVPFDVPVKMWNYFPKNAAAGIPFSRAGVTVPPATLTRVGAVFGILLYSPYAVSQCTFKFVGTGEDEGAIRDAEKAGIAIWLQPHAIGKHVMLRKDLGQAVEEWQQWISRSK